LHDDSSVSLSFDNRPDSDDLLIHEVIRVDDLTHFGIARVEDLLNLLSDVSSELELVLSKFSQGSLLRDLVPDDPVYRLFVSILLVSVQVDVHVMLNELLIVLDDGFLWVRVVVNTVVVY
jgi:hypothetical protein